MSRSCATDVNSFQKKTEDIFYWTGKEKKAKTEKEGERAKGEGERVLLRLKRD